MQTYGERVSRALQFVPGHVGGRVASAQPIRRRGGTLRSASVGAVAPPVTAPLYGYYDENYLVEGDTTVDVDMSAGFADVTGMVAISVAVGIGVTWTGPTGWTSLLSGTVGGLEYAAWWRRLTGTDDYTYTSDLAPAWTYAAAPDSTGQAKVFSWLFANDISTGSPVDAGLGVVATAATETASDDTISLIQPTSGWLSPTQFAFGTPATPVAGSHVQRIGSSPYSSTLGSNRPSASHASTHYFQSIYGTGGEVHTHTLDLSMFTDSGMGTPLAGEWVAFACGFA
jgi:hypothetical protein